jgi:serine protease
VDVAGYYQGGTPTEPGMFVALAPSRVLDTRPAPISSNSNYSLALLGKGGIPVTGVWAVVLNTTVTETTAPGFLTVYPGPTTMPLASNLNWTAGVTIPNHVTVPIGNDGKVRFYNGSGGTTQVIADTAGYYLT